MPGAVNGSSLHWFSAAFEARGAPFDEVIAFEARELRAKKLCAAPVKTKPRGHLAPNPQHCCQVAWSCSTFALVGLELDQRKAGLAST